MKTMKTVLATLLFVITVAEATMNVYAVSPDTGYTLSVNDQKVLDSVQIKAKTWYANRVNVRGKDQASKDLQTVIDKLGVLQMKYRNSPKNYAILYKLRVFCEGLLNPTSVAAAPVVSTVVATTTKQLSQAEAKKVDSTTATLDSQKNPSVAVITDTRKSLQSMGLSKVDSELLTMKLENGDGFEFCANFTPDLYPIEAEYRDAQSANSKQFDKLALRVVNGGNVWLMNENPGLYTSRITNYMRAVGCANSLYGRGQVNSVVINQAYIKNLMDKLGKTYTPQTKAFYDLGIDAKNLDSWVSGLGNGNLK